MISEMSTLQSSAINTNQEKRIILDKFHQTIEKIKNVEGDKKMKKISQSILIDKSKEDLSP